MTATQEEPRKILLKYCNNFIKMNKDEKSEGIKINYWMGIESQIKKLKIDNETSIKVIFDEIFKKQTSILKTRHLLYCITAFLKPMNEEVFVDNFFELLMIFAKEYDDNKTYFEQYLIDLSLNFFFKVNKGKGKGKGDDDKNKDKGKDDERLNSQLAFFNFLFEKDIEAFTFNFNSYYTQDTFAQNMFEHKSYVKLFIAYLYKISSLNQYHCIQYLLSYLKGIKVTQTEMKTNFKLFYKELLKILIEVITKNIINAFNGQLSSSISSIIQLIYFVIQLTFSFTNEIEGYDVFLLHSLELIISSKTFHFELIKILNDIYSSKDNDLNSSLAMFRKVYPCVVYFFSDSWYSKEHIDFYVKSIEQMIMLPLYKKIIIKRINVMQMIPQDMISQFPIAFKINDDNDNVNVNVNNQSKGLINSSFKYQIDESSKSLRYVSNIALIDYMINFCIRSSNVNDSQSQQIVYFNETKFYKILHCLSSLSINKLNPKLNEMLSEFLMIFISSIIDFSLSENIHVSDRIIEEVVSIIKQTSLDYQTETIYPIVIQIMRNALIPNYKLFIDNGLNKTIPLFFNYLCEFSRNDNIALLTSRLLVVLYNSKTLNGNEHKIYSLQTLVNLCVSANNSKIFGFYFNFAKEQINAHQLRTIALSSINDYASKYEGALQSPLIEYAMTMFQQIYDKSIDLMQFDSDTLFATSTIVQIFRKDKTENLIALLKQYFLKNTFIEVMTKIAGLITVNGNVIENELGIKEEDEYNDSKPQLDVITSVNILIDNIACLDYTKYVLEKQSKCSTCLFAILKQVSIILSELLSYFINEENVLNAQSSELKQQSPLYQCIVKYFVFFWEKIVNSTEKDTSKLIIINEILSNKTNYYFFYVIHSNLLANEQIEDTQSDFSHLEELTLKAINDKQNALIAFINKNKKRIFLFKEAFQMILIKEIQMLAMNNKQTQNKVIIINSIWTYLFDGYSHSNKDNQFMIDKGRSFFVIEFVSLLMGKDNLIQNQVLYCYFLYYNVFSTYFKQLTHLIDLDYIMLEYYSIIRNKNCPKELIGNFIEFILAFVRNSKPVQLFTLRIMSNSDILGDLIKKCDKKQERLFDIALIVCENLIKVNSYQMESKETLSVILNNMQKHLEDSLIYQKDYLIFYANFLLKLIQLISIKDNKRVSNDNEINPKLKSLLYDQLLNKLLPSLIQTLYKRIDIEFSNTKDKECINDQYIDYLYQALDAVMLFKSLGLVSDLTNGILDINIISFIDNLSQGSDLITNVFLNSLCNNYIVDLKINNVSMAKFTINYILYKSLSNNKENRFKTLKDQTLILFDENSKEQSDGIEHRKKIGYMLLLSSLFNHNTQSNISNNKSISIFNGQYELFQEIGEIMSDEINSFLSEVK